MSHIIIFDLFTNTRICLEYCANIDLITRFRPTADVPVNPSCFLVTSEILPSFLAFISSKKASSKGITTSFSLFFFLIIAKSTSSHSSSLPLLLEKSVIGESSLTTRRCRWLSVGQRIRVLLRRMCDSLFTHVIFFYCIAVRVFTLNGEESPWELLLPMFLAILILLLDFRRMELPLK